MLNRARRRPLPVFTRIRPRVRARSVSSRPLEPVEAFATNLLHVQRQGDVVDWNGALQRTDLGMDLSGQDRRMVEVGKVDAGQAQSQSPPAGFADMARIISSTMA